MRGSVHGVVVRPGKGVRVQSATVTIVKRDAAAHEARSLSDASGWFAFDGLLPGSWVVCVSGADGRVLGEWPVHVFDNAVSDITIEIGHVARGGVMPDIDEQPRSDRFGSVLGRVVHADTGSGVGEATIVVIQGAGPAPDIAPLTDAGGWFKLDHVPAGPWVFRAFGPGGEVGDAAVRVSGGSVSDVVIRIVPRA